MEIQHVRVAVDVDLKAFQLPNFVFLKLPNGEAVALDVGMLTRPQAVRYWEQMQTLWLRHINDRANLLQEIEKAA